MTQPKFRKWKSIEKFSDAFILANKYGVAEVEYRGKIKLHGTNAGIQFIKGQMYPQKRSDFISVANDNAGFAVFTSSLVQENPADGLILYGEWAGPGVQKGDAISSTDRKAFFVFSAYDIEQDILEVEPEHLEEIVKEIFGENYEDQSIYVLPWNTAPMKTNFQKQEECQTFIDTVMKEIDEVIAKTDPYVKEKFGVEGPGEGMVIYATAGKFLNGNILEPEHLTSYMFKAKTEAHVVQKTKNRNHVAPEKPEGIEDFISTFFTEARFRQMLQEIGGHASKEKTGEFMKAVMSDVHKESKNEIELANFEWKDVPKYAVPVVKAWWFNECNQLWKE